jgi:Esterase/lipase
MNIFNKNLLLTFTILFSIISSASIHAQEIHKNNVTTHIFSIKNNDTLKMDIYKPNKQGKSNCVIFLFGGGFFTGKRNSDAYKKYFNSLTNNGYTVASIDYRLGLKEFAKQMSNKNVEKPKFNPIKFVKLLMSSVNIAVEDLYSATNYLIENSEEFNINKDTIILSGSSAGAITVLQGEYYRTNWNATLNQKGNSNNNYTKKKKLTNWQKCYQIILNMLE